MTFAVHDDKTMNFISELSDNFELYAPTVSVVDGSPFTYEFFLENENRRTAFCGKNSSKNKVWM